MILQKERLKLFAKDLKESERRLETRKEFIYKVRPKYGISRITVFRWMRILAGKKSY